MILYFCCNRAALTNKPSLRPSKTLHCSDAAAKLLIFFFEKQLIRRFRKPLASSTTHQVAAVIHYRPKSVHTKWVALERNWGICLFLLLQSTVTARLGVQSMKMFISIQLHQSINRVLTVEAPSNLGLSVLGPSELTTKPELLFLPSKCPQSLF